MKTSTKLLKEHDKLVEKISISAYKEIEVKVRSIMRKHSRCALFCMAMGRAVFYDRNGESISREWGFLPYPEYLKKFDSWMEKFEDFNVKGMPMKIKGHDGQLITDW